MEYISYNMTRDYRKEWGAVEAVREIVQNCLDNKDCESTFELKNNVITIVTKGYTLPLSTLALGESQNKSEKTIGGFGEGYKLAMLVLTRLGLHPTVRFKDVILRGDFIYNEMFNKDVFNITVQRNFTLSGTPLEDTIFVFEFPEDLVNKLKHDITVFSEQPMKRVAEDEVNLINKAGCMYVDGLFITEVTRFKYGYNFSPTVVHLGSDRAIANPLGLAWETSKYWANRLDTDDMINKRAVLDVVLNLMMGDSLDVQDLSYFISEENSDELATEFIKKYGDVKIDTMSSRTMGFGVTTNVYNVLRKSSKINYVKPWEKEYTPYSQINKFLEENKKHMRSKARKNLQELLDTAKTW